MKKILSNYTFFKKYSKKSMITVLILNVIASLLDGLGLGLFIPLLSMFDENQNTDLQIFNISISEMIVNYELSVYHFLVGIFLLFTLKSIFKFLSQILQVKLVQDFSKNLRRETFNKVLDCDFGKIVEYDFGLLQNSLTTEVDKSSQAYKSFLKVLEGLGMVLTYITLAAFTNITFVSTLIVIGASLSLFYKKINSATKNISLQLVKINGTYQKLILELLNNIKYLKSTASGKLFSNKMKIQTSSIERANLKIGVLQGISLNLREPILVLALALSIYTYIEFLSGNFSLIIASILYFYRAIQTALILQNSQNQYLASIGSIIQVKKFLNYFNVKATNIPENKKKSSFQKMLFKHVDYNLNSNKIIDNLSFNINKNEIITIIGPSGSGKSTVLNLISGLYISPNIFINNTPQNQINMKRWREQIGYVTQDSVIFADTIFNNITLWDNLNEENLSRFKKVIKLTALSQLIEGLPLKELTELGSNGINISGGQKQRITIARELYAQKEILILDEFTASLDSETEQSLNNTIFNLKGQKTIVIASHRLDILKKSDKILIMENGKLIAFDKYERLIKNNNYLIEISKNSV